MADQKPCNIRSPHESHTWEEVIRSKKPEFIPGRIAYHLCPGKVWKAQEVRTHLTELIQTALEHIPEYSVGDPSPHMEIMEMLWPEVVGFLQPEDMPLKWSLGNPNPNYDSDYDFVAKPGQLISIPPNHQERAADAQERIAIALEKIEKHQRKVHWRNGE